MSAPAVLSDISGVRRHARLALAGAAGTLPTAAPPQPASELRPLGTEGVLQIAAAPRPPLLAPLLPEGGLMLVHGPRGIGRSHVLIGCTAALLSGGGFLDWRARRPVDVLFLSGAASSALLAARLGAALRALPGGRTIGERLRLLTPDRQEAAMPALDTVQGQAQLLPLLAQADVLVIDDAGPLVHGMNANTARNQWRFGEFLRRLRHAGRTVLIGQASGAAVRSRADRGVLACVETQADVVLGLRRPAGCAAGEGALFELHVERAGHLPRALCEVREVELACGRRELWRTSRASDLAKTRFGALLADGMPARDAARALGLDRTTAWRWAKRLAAANSPTPLASPSLAGGEPIAASDEPVQPTDTTIGIAA